MKLWRYVALYVIATLVGLGLIFAHASFLDVVGAVAVTSVIAMPLFYVMDHSSVPAKGRTDS